MKAGRFFRPHILIGSSVINFFRVIARLNFGIKGEVVFRLFVSFLILLALSPFRIIEFILFSFAKKEPIKQPIFIIGHPRSGTTYFHDTLNELDELVAPRMIDCLFPYMNKYFKFLLIPILKNALPETRLMDKMKVSWDSPQEEEFGMALMRSTSSVNFLFAPMNGRSILERYVLMNDPDSKSKWLSTHLRFAQKFQSMNKGKTLVFKSPSNSARMMELLEIYPDAKFIHIVRDPQDVIPSTLHLYASILPEFSLQNVKNLDLKAYIFQYYKETMRKFIDSKKGVGQHQLFEIRYEDFVREPIPTLKNCFNQLELKYSVDQLEEFFRSRKNFKKNKYSRDPELEIEIEEQCKPVVELYNYARS